MLALAPWSMVQAERLSIDEVDDAWRVAVSPYVWMPGLRGNGTIDGHGGHFRAPFHQMARELNFVTMGNIMVNKGRYGIFFDGQYIDLSKRLNFAMPGMSADAAMRSTQLSLGGSYRVYRRVLPGATLFGAPREWTVSPTMGIHWTRMRLRAWGQGRVAEHTNSWALPFIGVQSDYDLDDRWNLATQWDVGSWGRQYNLQGQLYLGYRLGIWGQESLLRIGGRFLRQNYRDEGWHWNVSQFGPVVGLSMRF
ncbi:hypothetical protein ACTVLT_14080 [Serratia bockelmannii]